MIVNNVQLIDLASNKAGNDSALARELGHGRAYVSQMRSGKRDITGEIAVKLAEIAGVPVEVALIAAMEARAKDPKERAGWQALRRLVMAVCFVALMGSLFPAPAIAAPTAGNPYAAGVSGDGQRIYIMRRKRRILSDWRSAFRAAVLRFRTVRRLLTTAKRGHPRRCNATA